MSLNGKYFTLQMFSFRVILEMAEEAKPKLGDKSPKYFVNLLYELFSTMITNQTVFKHNKFV